MDRDITVIGVVLVLTVLSPFVLHYISGKRKEKRFLGELKAMAGAGKFHLNHFDSWRNNYAIGLSEETGILFYVNRLKNLRSLVDLSEVADCRLSAVNRQVTGGNSSPVLVGRLDLVISYQDRNIKETVLEFFDSDEFITPDLELPVIRKWHELIKSKMSEKRKSVKR